ncbi:MAG: 2-oxoacid:ferredoxin oxidoreductase subunit beta [Chloroflexi bacterium]|nr:2-oxoacid:ferredoxin oxidoreductase subunit beta [Chloroflexota bacterium]
MVETATKLVVKDYKSDVKPTWCPGCGDFGVLSASLKALAELQLKKEDVVVVSGIGCSGRMTYFLTPYGMHGLHGRAIPLATGVKFANPDLTVLVMAGDGDLFSIGAGHLPHAAARNVDITVICMDNQTYGLTKAQASPTSKIGHTSKSTPHGVISEPANPVLTALSSGATFVARGYSAKPPQLQDLIVRGIQHKGFAFVHVQSPCTEFHDTFDYYNERIEQLPDDWDPSNREAAIRLALTDDREYLGLFYQTERAVYETTAREWAPINDEFDVETYLAQFA